MMDSLISYFDKNMDDFYRLIKTISILFISKLMLCILKKQYNLFQTNLSIEVILRIISFIFAKLLNISCSSNQKISSKGEITNYVLVDSQKLFKIVEILSQLAIFPIQINLYSYWLYRLLGVGFLCGFLILLSSLSMNSYLFKDLPKLKGSFLKKKDERMKETSETLAHLKLLKMYSWEDSFKNKVI